MNGINSVWSYTNLPLLWSLKVVLTAFLLVCFLVKKRAPVKIGKMLFISLQKLFSFSRKSNFENLDMQILWCYQMPKYIYKKIHFTEQLGK